MSGFLFKLETTEGAAAEPPTLVSAVPNWRAGETIPLGHKTLRVVGIRDDDADHRRCWWSRTWPNEPLARSLRLRRFARGRVVG
jgi:hypothetical protein